MGRQCGVSVCEGLSAVSVVGMNWSMMLYETEQNSEERVYSSQFGNLR